MSESTQSTETKKPAKATLTLVEKRKRRTTLRSAARAAEREKMKDAEFSKTFHAAKKTRANARVAAFKKARSGKK